MRAEDPRALAKRIAGCFRETRASAATGGGAAGGGAGWLYGRGNRTLAHASDVTTSVKHSILYLDNLKAASTTSRLLLRSSLGMDYRIYWPDRNASWMVPGIESPPVRSDWATSGCVQRTRVTSQCFRAEVARAAYSTMFSFVRDPVSKFESAVKQAWHNTPLLKGWFPNADAMLDAQLALYAAVQARDDPEAAGEASPPSAFSSALLECAETRGCPGGWQGLWIDEHLAPAGWRFGGTTADGVPASDLLNWVGRTEHIDQVWDQLAEPVLQAAAASGAHSPRKMAMLRRLYEHHAPHANPRHTDHMTDPGVLSAAGVRRFCNSELFRHEFECLGYERPPECGSVSGASPERLRALERLWRSAAASANE
jgi:hypothetical protein